MQLFDIEIPGWLLLVTLLMVILYWHGTSTYTTFKNIGVPYVPARIPYIGHLVGVLSQSSVSYDMEMRGKFPGKVWGMFVGTTPDLMVADAEFLKEVTIRQHNKFRNHKSLLEGEDNIHTRHVGVVEDDHWKHVRSILTPTFTSGKLKQMFPVIKNCADKLKGHLNSTEAAPVNFKDYAAGYTMDVIASTAFGLDLDSQTTTEHPFVVHAGTLMGAGKQSSNILNILKGFFMLLVLLLFPKFLRLWLSKYLGISFINRESLQYFEQIIDKLVEERRKDPNSEEEYDFISVASRKVVDLREVKEEEVFTTATGFKWTTAGLTRKDFIANSTIFFSAGYETTATALQFFCYAMTLYPDIQDKLFEHLTQEIDKDSFTYEQLQSLEYLDWCVSESLRMFPPVVRIERFTNADAVVKGINIPKGLYIHGLVYAIHHDPDYWPEPESFIPERFSPQNKTEIQQYAWLPFGAGGRSCIANRLALLEIKVAVVKLFTSFRFEKTAETVEPKDITYKPFSGFLLPISPLQFSAVPR